ncbi:hypothetical protein PROVRETT_08675 [Providencia rettgeri DSM 1131]|nr:hypothetical protein PROVRETT_08675 [Providencia rettgeri DSM 1131]
MPTIINEKNNNCVILVTIFFQYPHIKYCYLQEGKEGFARKRKKHL